MATMTNLIDILSLVSSSAMKGSIFLGELPTSLAVESSQIEAKDNRQDRIRRLLVNHGFRVNATSHDEINKDTQLDESGGGSLLFIAKQLRFSDAQMEMWRTHLERMEDDGEEEGFEEL